ncbi:MAG: hypothetical protein QOF01_5412 [Thermomicrobiales bacterium]|nr:hypothetical protein [Thermomicrobiales bacterium]
MNVWAGAERYIDRTADVERLRAHGIQLLAVRHWRATGRSVPLDLIADERFSAIVALSAPSLLGRIRCLLDGPLVVLKGPEVAARYPDPALRGYGDLDILVPDPAGAQAVLVDAGFELVDDYAFPHHDQPLHWPGSPLLVELHRFPSWLRWMTPPSTAELFAMAVPSATGIDGVSTLPAREHALFVAAHSWRHAPLRRLIDLIDVALMAEGVDPYELDALARQWGMGRVWATTTHAIADLFSCGDAPVRSRAVRFGGRHLTTVRDRTVLEKHLAMWLGALWAPTPSQIPRMLVATIADDVRPLLGEPWTSKLGRIGRACRDAFSPWSIRDRAGTDRRTLS